MSQKERVSEKSGRLRTIRRRFGILHRVTRVYRTDDQYAGVAGTTQFNTGFRDQKKIRRKFRFRCNRGITKAKEL
jgi:hypothetical protein